MKAKKGMFLGAFLIGTSSLLVGCKKEEKVEPEKDVLSSNLVYSIDKKNEKKMDVSMSDFNLGKAKLGDLDEEQIEVDLKGTIAVPKKVTNAPIIFILSGNHNYLNIEDRDGNEDFHKGFEYLVKSLAEEGFLTVAINTELEIDKMQKENVVEDKILNLLYEKHFEKLRSAITGNGSNYPVSLYKKGDLENIGLIGQLNTGRTIFNICNEQEFKESYNIKGLLSVTPSEALPVSSYPDVPTSVLITEYSSSPTIGFDLFSDIENEENRESLAGLTYLIGGSSDKFNSRLKESALVKNNEVSNSKNTKNLTIEEINNIIDDSTAHEEFLISYAIDFFNEVFSEEKFDSIYNVELPVAQSLYSKNVLTKLFVSKSKVLYDANKINNISSKNVKLKPVVESSIPEIDTAINFNEPGTNIELNLTDIEWKSKTAQISIPVTEKDKDFSNFKSMSFNWALNHASTLNQVSQKGVTLSLEDYDGNVSSVLLESEIPLKKIEGKIESKELQNGTSSTNWSKITPIAESRIPLEYFKNINMKNIKNIMLTFEKFPSGSLLIKDIKLKK